MAYTDKYREQHVELASLATQLNRTVDQVRTDDDCAQVRKTLNQLAGKLMVHLSMEDKGMYPRLASHENGDLRATAASFAREMGGIAQAFEAYNNRWTSAAIRADVAGFAAETRKVVQVLLNRIQSENTRLYPMVDRHVA
jgi:iron-sulfur cluster repair protein YtfE (RIC family)